MRERESGKRKYREGEREKDRETKICILQCNERKKKNGRS